MKNTHVLLLFLLTVILTDINEAKLARVKFHKLRIQSYGLQSYIYRFLCGKLHRLSSLLVGYLLPGGLYSHVILVLTTWSKRCAFRNQMDASDRYYLTRVPWGGKSPIIARTGQPSRCPTIIMFLLTG